jgi:hypothetical protein
LLVRAGGHAFVFRRKDWNKGKNKGKGLKRKGRKIKEQTQRKNKGKSKKRQEGAKARTAEEPKTAKLSLAELYFPSIAKYAMDGHPCTLDCDG